MKRISNILLFLLSVTLFACWVSTLSSFHQTAREEQLKQQDKELQEYKRVFELGAKGDYKSLDNFMRERYGEKDYCICVPWSEKMIKKMGRDVFHGTKRVYKSMGGQ